ncbi:MAG: glycine--tRNA ligase [Candidatus Brennerbacteria bacterium]|nr:glycine--tRNA ligase [Candidatus Brennerbacteria bacterium]
MTTLEKIVSLAKRRGFVFPGSEIYGGLSGLYDWGPLGDELKFNIEQAWWRDAVQLRDDVVGISAAIVMNPKVWEASGHVTSFSDPLESGERFNTMFGTSVGVGEEAVTSYLRPETAQGIFVNFKNVVDSLHLKLPFGIAQIGRAFRNEIAPRNFIFRTREFEQVELEYFVKPGDDEKYFKEWVKNRLNWYKSIGLKNVKPREQSKEERAHYSKATIDIEYKFPFGVGEIEGVANRGDFDLQAHMKASGVDLSYLDEETKERYVPYVIEPSAGVERIALALLCEAYTEEKDRIVLKLHPRLAPYKVAVFPLLANKPKLTALAKSIYYDLKKDFVVAWDDRGNIGKRYYSQDEIGTPYCITVDFESLEHDDVTVRDRDTMKQKRVKIKELTSFLRDKLS